MSNRLHLFLFLLFVIFLFPQEGLGQYYPENFREFTWYAPAKSKKLKPEYIEIFKKAPLVIIKAEPKKSKKKSGKKLLEEKRHNASVRSYNQLIDSLARKYYPYENQVFIKTRENAERLFKKEPSKVYATMELKNNDTYVFFGLSDSKKPFFAVPFHWEKEDESFIATEANIIFIFQRLELYFERRLKGGIRGSRTYKAMRKELNERLDRELNEKVLLLNKDDFDEDFDIEDIPRFYDYQYKVVDTEFIDSVVINKTAGYYYLKICPYLGVGNWGMSNKRMRTPYGAHYIIDPQDGAVVFLSYKFHSEIFSTGIKMYNEQLTKSNLVNTYFQPLK